MTVQSIDVTLPDGSIRAVAPGTSVRTLASMIGKRLGEAAIGAVIGPASAKDDVASAQGSAKIVDVHTPLNEACRVRIVTVGSDEGLEVLRHSAAHLMATAVTRLFKGTQVTIGPAIATGFFYDFARDKQFSDSELAQIEAEMRAVAQKDLPFEREEVSRQTAKALFEKMGEHYKCELIDAIPEGETITLYHLGDWVDLCRGPHVPSSRHLKAFKLTHVAGAYWRGDERNAMLTRIYGTAFWTQKDLDAHFVQVEEAKKRDHRKLGKDLDLFSFDALAPAMPFFHAHGATVWRLLADFIRSYYKVLGFDEVMTPQLVDTQLFDRSGHLQNYRDNMFFSQVEDRQFGLKPMNCPGHTLLYANRRRSFRELPVRMADFGRLHRFERSGTTAGLTRVRSFCQDDAHIFCRDDQVGFEIATQIAMIKEVFGHFGFIMRVFLSTRPEQSLGREPGLAEDEVGEWDHLWHRAETALEAAIREAGLAFALNPGDGAFYGPKIDCEVKDAIGRWHQLGTIQLDFALPKRFDLTYVTSNGALARPVMVHRAVLGSLERFMGILIEHTYGDFPVWLAPVQVRIVTLNDALLPYGKEVADAFSAAGMRCEVDTRTDKLGAKIRAAELQKVPIVAVVGGREAEAKQVSLRWRKSRKDQVLPLDQAILRVLDAAAVPKPSTQLVRRMADAWQAAYVPKQDAGRLPE